MEEVPMPARRVALAILVSGALAACGGGDEPSPGAQPTTPPATSPSPTVTAACAPSGETELHVVAEGVKFDADCLAVPADTAFTIEFTNKDAAIQHNIVIQNGEQFLSGDSVFGKGKITYEVDPIPAGIYRFYCQFHIGEMQGQFVVQ
jgi:plastocyanin